MYEYRDAMTAKYGLNLVNVIPNQTVAEQEQQFRRSIEPMADPVHHRGDVLAHAGIVRATATHRDLFRLREQPALPIGHALHHPLRQLALDLLLDLLLRA